MNPRPPQELPDLLLVLDQEDPRDDCAPDGTLCGADGLCDGAGACRLLAAEGTQCGSDGCGGSCGTCEPGWFCNDQFQCEESVCVPDCTGSCSSEYSRPWDDVAFNTRPPPNAAP